LYLYQHDFENIAIYFQAIPTTKWEIFASQQTEKCLGYIILNECGIHGRSDHIMNDFLLFSVDDNSVISGIPWPGRASCSSNEQCVYGVDQSAVNDINQSPVSDQSSAEIVNLSEPEVFVKRTASSAPQEDVGMTSGNTFEEDHQRSQLTATAPPGHDGTGSYADTTLLNHVQLSGQTFVKEPYESFQCTTANQPGTDLLIRLTGDFSGIMEESL
jgi:hypothetical protein